MRTKQINFRCSPEFIELVKGMADKFGGSIADVLEEAAHLLAEHKHYERPKHG